MTKYITIDTKTNNQREEDNESEELHENSVKLMTPMQMVLRRFFRSKLSIIGLIMVVSLFLFSFVGPLVYTQWGEIELDERAFSYYNVNIKDWHAESGEYKIIVAASSRDSRLYDTVREVDDDHIITMEAIWTGFALPYTFMRGWENVVYQVHFYNNSDFIFNFFP